MKLQLCHRIVFVFLLFSLSGCGILLKPTLKTQLIEIQPGEYVLDPDHTTVLFKIDHMGFSKFVGRFNHLTASLNFDPVNIEKSSLEAIIDMGSVDVNNEKFERALKGKFWFNAKKYPQAYFKTTAATRSDENTLVFDGELTFLGRTEKITLIVSVNGAANNLLTGKYTLGFSAKSVFKRSSFGLDKYIPAVGDDVELEIYTEFQKSQ
jgi:polyisoprenoid-binding protein YceI